MTVPPIYDENDLLFCKGIGIIGLFHFIWRCTQVVEGSALEMR